MSDAVKFRVHVYGADGGPIDNSFESAEQRLVEDIGAYFEPDGSFAWSAPGGGEQIFGMLYDAGGRIQYVDLQGQVSRESLRRVLLAIVGAEANNAGVPKIPTALCDLTLKSLIRPGRADSGRNDLQSFEEWAFG